MPEPIILPTTKAKLAANPIRLVFINTGTGALLIPYSVPESLFAIDPAVGLSAQFGVRLVLILVARLRWKVQIFLGLQMVWI